MEKRFALGVSVFFGQTLSVFPLFSMLGLLLIPAPLVGTMSSDRLKQCLSEVSIAIENDGAGLARGSEQVGGCGNCVKTHG